jgi:hypothetical protein
MEPRVCAYQEPRQYPPGSLASFPNKNDNFGQTYRGTCRIFLTILDFTDEMSDKNVAFRRMTIRHDCRLTTMATGDRMLEEDNKNVAAKAWPTYLSAFWFEWR